MDRSGRYINSCKGKRDGAARQIYTAVFGRGKAAGSTAVRAAGGKIAVRHQVAAMHDVTEGGIFGALWEMAEASGVGLEIDLRKIPIRQETVEICEYFDINPYELISSGCMLMAAADGNTIVRELEKAGIHAVVAGKATDGNDRVLYTARERRFLEPPKSDELYKVV